MSEHTAWAEQVTRELGVDPTIITELGGPMLDTVRDVAHGVSGRRRR